MPQHNSVKYIRQLEQLVELSRNLGRSEDLDMLLLSFIDVAMELTQCEMATIMIYEEETDLLKFIAAPLGQREILRHIRVPVERSLAGQVYKSGQPVLILDATRDTRIFHQVEYELGLTMHQVAVVPLLFQDQSIGVFEAINKRNGQLFEQEDIKTLETLASLAAIAILNNLLFDEVKRAQDDVQALERMKTNFIAITSHELRTPVGLVLGHASFLEDMIQDVELKEQLDVIVRSATRLKAIVEDLSNIQKAAAGTSRLRYQLLSINQLAHKVVILHQKMAQEKKISLKARLPEQELVVDADEEKITIVLNNLIRNALTYTDPGGHVLVIVERVQNHVQVSVIDDGIGIPAADLPKVFDRFFQVQSHLTRRHGGMGLGLSVAKVMVELHNGEIYVESVEKKGSKFTFLLPQKSSGQLKRIGQVHQE